MRVWSAILGSLCWVLLGTAKANHRVALVIGNREYRDKDALPTVAQDAEKLSRLLQDRDFRVTTALNRTRDDLRVVLEAFIDSTPINGTALIYFSGHSMTAKNNQGEMETLLLTVDGNRKAIVLGDLLEQVGERSAAKATIILVDSGKGIAPGYDERRGPVGLNAIDTLPEGVSLQYGMAANSWSDHPGSLVKRLSASSAPNLETWLSQVSRWQLSTCERGSISRPAAHAISPPETLVRGRKAGDEWVSPQGTVFCWCPAKEELAGFWIGKHEARLSQFPAMTHRLHRSEPTRSLRPSNVPGLLADLTKEEQKAGRLPANWEYALPTPEQWEYAARAGTEGERYFSEDEPLSAHANFADHSLFKEVDDRTAYADPSPRVDDGFAGVAPVGSFAPNPWGLHDVLGNVWEQTSTGELRGGSWVSPREYLKLRMKKLPPSSPHDKPAMFPYALEFAGFRIVLQEK